MTILFLVLSLFFLFIQVYSAVIPIESGYPKPPSGSHTYYLSLESSCKIPFTLYLNALEGIANIQSISTDESGAFPITDFISDIVGTAQIITFLYVEYTEYYFHVSCTQCGYYIYVRRHDDSLARTLLYETTNYEILPQSKNITFTIPEIEDTYHSRSLVTITSFNCPTISNYSEHILTQVLDKSERAFVIWFNRRYLSSYYQYCSLQRYHLRKICASQLSTTFQLPKQRAALSLFIVSTQNIHLNCLLITS